MFISILSESVNIEAYIYFLIQSCITYLTKMQIWKLNSFTSQTCPQLNNKNGMWKECGEWNVGKLLLLISSDIILFTDNKEMWSIPRLSKSQNNAVRQSEES